MQVRHGVPISKFAKCYYDILERRYTDKHEWIEVDGNVGIVGISQYAQVRFYSLLNFRQTQTIRNCQKYFVDRME